MCDNKVFYTVPRGYDYRQVEVKCGNTAPDGTGERAVCQKCNNDPEERARIDRHEQNVEADNAWLRSAGWGEM